MSLPALIRRAGFVALPLLVLVVLSVSSATSPAHAQRAAGAGVVREGYERLLSVYVDPLDPAELLNEAWNGAAAEAIAAGLRELPALPPLPAGQVNAWAAFAAAYDDLERLSAGLIAPQQLAYAALDAMAAARNECHTYYLTPDDYVQFQAQLDGRAEFVGIGVRISQRAPFTIVSVIPDSPAERAGLAEGDVIVTVDGIPAAEQTLASLRALIAGPEGSVVTLVIQRPGEDAPRAISITRGTVRIPILTTTLRPDGIGVLTLNTFATDGSSERMLRAALRDLEAQGAIGWVLDLRGNGGGSVTSVLNVLGVFLTHEVTAITEVDRHTGSIVYPPLGQPAAVQRPLAVLIGPASASGAEIVAKVLQDTHRARLFGQRSAGCANVGSLNELSDGSAMVITSARLLAGPQLRTIDGVGVTPDQEIAVGPGDPALQAAVAYLRSGMPVVAQ